MTDDYFSFSLFKQTVYLWQIVFCIRFDVVSSNLIFFSQVLYDFSTLTTSLDYVRGNFYLFLTRYYVTTV